MSISPVFHQAIDDQPWIPGEYIKFDDQAVVGYVVESSSDWTYILTDGPRLINVVPTRDIYSRQPCAVEGQSGKESKTLWRLFAKTRDGYPLRAELATAGESNRTSSPTPTPGSG